MKIVWFIYLLAHFFSIIIFYDHKRKCTKVLVRDHLTALRQMKSISQRRNNCWKRKIMSCEDYERGRKDITTMKPFISYSKRGYDSPDPPSASSLFCYRRVSSTGAAWTGYGLQGLEYKRVYNFILWTSRTLEELEGKRSVVQICGISIFIFVLLRKVA